MPTQEDLAANPYQYALLDYTTATPEGDVQAVGYTPRYLTDLLQRQQLVEQGQATPWEQQLYQMQVDVANAVPMRDPATLQYDAGEQGPTTLSGGSPDLARLMLGLRQKMQQGTATDQERNLYGTTLDALKEQTYRSVVPQASDALSPFGDNLLSALGILGIGATGGLAGGALAAGGGLASTLGSLGTLSGIAGTGAGVLGQATDQDWLSQLGLGLGIAGGLAGGLGGMSTLWSSGVGSLSDAAKLAQSAGKITGSLGRIPGADPLKDVSRYLGYAGQAGQFGAGVGADDWLGWSGTNSPTTANVAPNVQHLLSAADVATQRGGTPMAWDDYGSTDWLDWSGGGQGPLLSDAGPGIDWSAFTAGGPGSWAGQETTDFAGGGGGGFWGSILSGLGGLAKSALPTAAKAGLGGAAGTAATSGWLGPLLSSLGSVGGGAIGSNAANEAARLQAAAANRGIDLQTSQWLQQQANLAPYLQAGQQGLSQLQQLAGRQQPNMPGVNPSVQGSQYGLPSPYPGWSPQQFQRPNDLNAMDYRYSAPATVNLAQHAWNPQGAMDPSQYGFSAPNGQELLARDPGYQFRQEEARKAIDASAAARGGLLSGSTLSALQRQSQDLASQEYGQAYGRALGENQLRYGRGLTQTQEDYQRQLAANQLGYGRATEQQQLGYQQGLGAQGFNWQTALQGQQNAFTQGLTAEQWAQKQQEAYATQLYDRQAQQAQQMYGRDVYSNQTDYERQQAAYKQQLAQYLLPWEQSSTLANLGGQAVNMYGNQGGQASRGISDLLAQLGSAQGAGAAGSGLMWNRALTGATNQLPSILAGLNA